MDDSSDHNETDGAEPKAVPDNDTPGMDLGAEQLPAPGSASLPDILQGLLPRQAKPYMGSAAEESMSTSPLSLDDESGTPITSTPSGSVAIKNAHQLLDAAKPHFGTWVPRLIRAITKSGDDALVLSQILYWFDRGKDGRPRARKFVGGERYVYKTHAALGSELGIPAGRVKDSLKRLRQAGFIDTKYKLAEGGRTSHIRPLIPNIAKAMTKASIDLPPIHHVDQEKDSSE